MDVHEALLSRRTVHDYRPEPVADAIVDQALLAAHHAPVHKLTWPWRFTRVGPVARGALVELGVRVKRARGPLSPEAEARVRSKMGDPGALVIASQVRSEDPLQAREDYAAVACAIENLMLSLRGDGVYSKWTTGGVTTHPEAYAAAAIDPRVEEIVGFVWIGYPRREPKIPRRPPLEQVVRAVP